MDNISDIPVRKILLNEYPVLLRDITKPPPFMYLMGVIPPDNYKVLCVVGSRHHSAYGKEVCQRLVTGLYGYPIVIVSGLAIGIDSIAHEAALEAGLKTVAFPGSGLRNDVIYPQSHRHLARRIVKGGGAILSPFEMHQNSAIWTFPVRNHLMSGMSHATLVIEARHKSGTLITSTEAGGHGRGLLAVPGNIFSDLSSGPNNLIRTGATAVTTSRDILEVLGFDVPADDDSENNADGKISMKRDFRDPVKRYLNNDSLNAEEKRLIALLTSPRSRDELIEKMSLDAARLNTLLAGLELRGFVTDLDGEIIIK